MGNSRPFDRRVSTCANKTEVLACTVEQAGHNLSKKHKIITHEQYNTYQKSLFSFFLMIENSYKHNYNYISNRS